MHARQILAGGPPPDVFIVDVVMPGESGPAFVRSFDTGRTPVVFMSGYSESEIERRGLPARIELLEKPFTGQQLLGAVRKALAQDGQ
jgi:FixJ family two-component response regulator